MNSKPLDRPALARALSLAGAVALVLGNVVGVGIFLTPG
jgi:hypothetical protein